MLATFISGPCGDHSHAIDDNNDIPQTLPPVCGPSRGEADATGYYVRVGSAHGNANGAGAATTTVIFYKWAAEEGGAKTNDRDLPQSRSRVGRDCWV
jgi:hypothetical protein